MASTERQASHILADSRIGCQKLGEVVRDDFAKKEWVCECLPNWADEGAGSQGKGVALQVMEDQDDELQRKSKKVPVEARVTFLPSIQDP